MSETRKLAATWAVTSAGVELHAERFSGILDFEIQPDKSVSIAAYNMIGNDCK